MIMQTFPSYFIDLASSRSRSGSTDRTKGKPSFLLDMCCIGDYRDDVQHRESLRVAPQQRHLAHLG
jgi:hypothetical protein